METRVFCMLWSSTEPLKLRSTFELFQKSNRRRQTGGRYDRRRAYTSPSLLAGALRNSSFHRGATIQAREKETERTKPVAINWPVSGGTLHLVFRGNALIIFLICIRLFVRVGARPNTTSS